MLYDENIIKLNELKQFWWVGRGIASSTMIKITSNMQYCLSHLRYFHVYDTLYDFQKKFFLEVKKFTMLGNGEGAISPILHSDYRFHLK